MPKSWHEKLVRRVTKYITDHPYMSLFLMLFGTVIFTIFIVTTTWYLFFNQALQMNEIAKLDMDCYAILGVKRDASSDQIKEAHRNLALKLYMISIFYSNS